LPAVGPDAAVAEHLEVLHLLRGRRLLRISGEGVSEAGAVNCHLRHAVDRCRFGDADGLENGWRDIRDRVELTTDAALLADALRPVYDQRIANAATMGVLLVALARRVADLGPAPGIVVETLRRADVIDRRHAFVDRLRTAVEEARVVDHAARAALLAGAVVG